MNLNNKLFRVTIILAIVFLSGITIPVKGVYAADLTSTNYKFEKVSIQIGGKDETTSTTYKVAEGEITDDPMGTVTSTSYIMEVGGD